MFLHEGKTLSVSDVFVCIGKNYNIHGNDITFLTKQRMIRIFINKNFLRLFELETLAS